MNDSTWPGVNDGWAHDDEGSMIVWMNDVLGQ